MLVRGLGDERDDAEKDLLESGLPLALSHRAAWAKNFYRHQPWFLLVLDENEKVCAGVAIEQIRPRSSPGALILRVGRFGGNLPPEVSRVVLEAIAHLTRHNQRIVRSVVQVFTRGSLEAIGDVFKEVGNREEIQHSGMLSSIQLAIGPETERRSYFRIVQHQCSKKNSRDDEDVLAIRRNHRPDLCSEAERTAASGLGTDGQVTKLITKLVLHFEDFFRISRIVPGIVGLFP